MAKQVNFYSVTSSSAATTNPNPGGVYFVNNTTGFESVARIYKDGKVFGADADALIAGLVAGTDANSYIASITKDATTGKLTANAKPLSDIGNSIGSSWAADTKNGITVSVTTSAGKVTNVSVSASQITCNTVSATSATFTDLIVNSSATFTATTVSANTLTVGGTAIGDLISAGADARISAIAESYATGGTNGLDVKVTTQSGKVTGVSATLELKASVAGTANAASTDRAPTEKAVFEAIDRAVSAAVQTFDDVMFFGGVSTKLSNLESDAAGTVVLIGASPTGFITSSGSAAATSNNGENEALVAGQEYVWTGEKWELIGDQGTYATKAALSAAVSDFNTALDLKASIGTSVSEFKGISASIDLTKNAKPTIKLLDNGIVTTGAGVTSTADKLVTASAVNGFVTAISGTSTSADKGISVTVSTSAGKVMADGGVKVAVTAATLSSSLGLKAAAFKDVAADTMSATGTNLPTEKAVAAYVSTFASDAAAKASTGSAYSSIYGMSVSMVISSDAAPKVSLTAPGVVTASANVAGGGTNLVTAGAVADYVTASIGALDSSITSGQQSALSVGVVQSDGVITSVTATFVWLDANGAVVP